MRDRLWWLIEQFSVLFIPAPSVKNEGGELVPCSTCWWYRGVLLGYVTGSLVTGLVVYMVQ